MQNTKYLQNIYVHKTKRNYMINKTDHNVVARIIVHAHKSEPLLY